MREYLNFYIDGQMWLREATARDRPLDRRLLFVAELSDRKWWGQSVTLRRWRLHAASALQAAPDLYRPTTPLLDDQTNPWRRRDSHPPHAACKAASPLWNMRPRLGSA